MRRYLDMPSNDFTDERVSSETRDFADIGGGGARCIRLFIYQGETIIDLLYTIYIDIQGNLKKFDMLFNWEKVLFSIHVDLLDQD